MFIHFRDFTIFTHFIEIIKQECPQIPILEMFIFFLMLYYLMIYFSTINFLNSYL